MEALVDPPGAAGRGPLAVGDVEFRAGPGQSEPTARPTLGVDVIAQRVGCKPLPGTGPEARRACALFQTAFGGQPTEVLTRAASTEAEAKRRSDGSHWRVVHLGTQQDGRIGTVLMSRLEDRQIGPKGAIPESARGHQAG